MQLRDIFPDNNRVVIRNEANKSALQSLWLGVSVPLIHLPMSVWYLVLLPAGRGLWCIWASFVAGTTAGLLGHIHLKD